MAKRLNVNVDQMKKYCVICKKTYGELMRECCTPNSLVGIFHYGLFNRKIKYYSLSGNELAEDELLAIFKREEPIYQQIIEERQARVQNNHNNMTKNSNKKKESDTVKTKTNKTKTNRTKTNKTKVNKPEALDTKSEKTKNMNERIFNKLNLPKFVFDRANEIVSEKIKSIANGSFVFKVDSTNKYLIHYEMGLKYYNSGNYVEAINDFTKSWELNNNFENLKSLALLGSSYIDSYPINQSSKLLEATDKISHETIAEVIFNEHSNLNSQTTNKKNQEFIDDILSIALNDIGKVFRVKAEKFQAHGISMFDQTDPQTLKNFQLAKQCYEKADMHFPDPVYKENIKFVTKYINILSK